jgi:hypothetical protein
MLDTNTAEAALPGRFEAVAHSLEWGNSDRPWMPRDFRDRANRNTAAQIAEFAVRHGVNAVLSPSHLLDQEGPQDPWFDIDRDLCLDLRNALDAAGGKDISIDYHLMIPYACLLKEVQRRTLAARLDDLPVENIWIRTGNFGRDATASKFEKFVVGLHDFHSTGKPIVADCVGGLVGLGAAAFGTIGALAHGVAERERFDPSGWKRPPRPRNEEQEGGSCKWVYFPPLDRLLRASQAELLLRAHGAKPFLLCNDRSCCPRGEENMLGDHKAHFLRQRRYQLDDLGVVPESRRASHYVERHLIDADRYSRRAAKLKTGDEALNEILKANSQRLDDLRQVGEYLLSTLPQTSRSGAPTLRSGRHPDNTRNRVNP